VYRRKLWQDLRIGRFETLVYDHNFFFIRNIFRNIRIFTFVCDVIMCWSNSTGCYNIGVFIGGLSDFSRDFFNDVTYNGDLQINIFIKIRPYTVRSMNYLSDNGSCY